MPDTTADTMTVTVKLEASRPDCRQDVACWVARNADGVWHCWCFEHFADSPGAAVAAMYHACEVASVDEHGDTATATLYQG